MSGPNNNLSGCLENARPNQHFVQLAAIRQKEDEDLEKYGQRVMHLSYRAFADFSPAD